jgi:hypothetical protein
MRSNRIVKFFAAAFLPVLVALVVLNPVAQAQLTSGDLVGTITDPTGAAVPQAKVDIVEETTGVKTAQSSDGNGQYRFNNLPIGKYDLTISATGFSTNTLKGVAIELNKTATQNINLVIGQVSQTLEVVDAAETIDTSTAQIQTNFNARLAAARAFRTLAAWASEKDPR